MWDLPAPPFALFVVALSFFHCSEFLLALTFDRANLGWHSWLFSWPYCTAMLTACIEHAVELRWAPGIKLRAVSWAGLVAVAAGELLRKAAMVQARHNFTHMIQMRKRPEHTLVTSGAYAWVRHPGYAGWAVWAVGTQLLLCNPLCTLLFAAAAWRFFDRRIRAEERLLASFFGDAWQAYRGQVPSGIPGIP